MTQEQTKLVEVTLLPCPRCGDSAFVTIHFGVWCGADLCLKLPARASRAEAIAAWNTRAFTTTQSQITALREALFQIAAATYTLHDGGEGFGAELEWDDENPCTIANTALVATASSETGRG